MKKQEPPPRFSPLEQDALKEAMNISFGSASAELNNLMDIFVKLNIPGIDIIEDMDLLTYLRKDNKDFDTTSMVLQDCYGDFEGRIILLFPYGAEKELISYFKNPDTPTFQSDELVELEKEVLLEIGSFLMGACVGKFYEFLRSRISYRPPQCLQGRTFRKLLTFSEGGEKESRFISLRTSFSFEDRSVAGQLYLIHREEAADYLKGALSSFKELNP
jgi:chemotaxis protein CheC